VSTPTLQQQKSIQKEPYGLNQWEKTSKQNSVNWLSNGLDEHYTEENDAIFS
jgi:hypothetical protein